MKLRIVLILILLAIFVSHVQAQTNCCVIATGSPSTVGQVVNVPANAKGPGGSYIPTATQTIPITCTDSATAKACSSSNAPNNVVTAAGIFGYDGNGNFVACNPTFTSPLGTVQSSSTTTYPTFTNYGISYVSNTGTTCNPSSTESFATSTCPTVACPSGGGGGGGGCVGSGGDEGEPSRECPSKGASPILLDISGKGFYLTSAEDGVKFDMSGTGVPIQIGWTAPGADIAFLALPGADGLIHNGKQLFGNFTPQPPSKRPNGFAALAVYDEPKNGGNGDGIIDKRDAIFSSLRLWIDLNHDGISQPDEIFALPALGINSISLKYTEDRKTDQYGNQFRYRARLNPDKPDDAGKIVYDVFFVTLDSTQSASLCLIPPIAPRSSRVH